MNINQTCPPIPSLQQFADLYQNKYYILADVETLQQGEYVLSTQPNWDYLICIEIGENNEHHLQFRLQHVEGEGGFINDTKVHINSVRGTDRELLFFKKNPRIEFDKAVRMIENRINNKTIDNVSGAMKNVLGDSNLTKLIGDNLGPYTFGNGGRRKSKRTRRRTRKNKRKSTRRTGRKCKR